VLGSGTNGTAAPDATIPKSFDPLGSVSFAKISKERAMKIIRFPSIQGNVNPSVSNHPNAPLLFQYRDGAQGELLVWAIDVFCAVASVVLAVGQLKNDVNRVRRTHLDRIRDGGQSCLSIPLKSLLKKHS